MMSGMMRKRVLRGLGAGIALTLVLATSARAAGDGKIAYVDEEGDLFTVRSDGSEAKKLASADPMQAISWGIQPVAESNDFFTWPAWSPDASRIAAFRVSAEGERVVDSLLLLDVETSRVVESYQKTGIKPIYQFWSPTGSQLAMLLQTDDGFALSLWPNASSDRPQKLATGAPFFYHWNKDGRRLLIHVGNDKESEAGHTVRTLGVDGEKGKILSDSPAVFGPASWSADEKWMAYATMDKAGAANLIVAKGDGSEPKSVGKISPRVAFNWAPDRSVLAVAKTESPDDPAFREVSLIDPATGKTTLLRKDAIAAFFWSPNGKLLLLATREMESNAWHWRVVDTRTKDERDLGRFFPSRPMNMVFSYFDQYALSHRLWSPDSRSFVFSGAIEKDPASPHPLISPRIYVADASGKSAPQGIADGHTAFWSPK